jgi:hypothetical protein
MGSLPDTFDVCAAAAFAYLMPTELYSATLASRAKFRMLKGRSSSRSELVALVTRMQRSNGLLKGIERELTVSLHPNFV